jgi:murein DD-endopeptidase MepM/ murein hydrolase activator NlpD
MKTYYNYYMYNSTKRILLFLFIIFILSVDAKAQFALKKYVVIPENPRPGEPVTIGTESDAKSAILQRNGRQLSKTDFFYVTAADGKPGFTAAVITIPSTIASGNSIIRVENKNGEFIEIPLKIAPREFSSEIIELNSALTGIRTDSSPQRENESNRLSAVLNTTGNQIYHTGMFIPPVTSSRRTSFFGDRRVFKYSNGTSDTSIHAGVDFGVPTGTRVTSCAAGKVVIATSRIVTGNTVVIEHAPGIYSLYYHLDRIEVREGAIIEAGILLGFSGSTGLATGPHLHWEVRVSAENTDPDFFVSHPIIDKDLIISKIFN